MREVLDWMEAGSFTLKGGGIILCTGVADGGRRRKPPLYAPSCMPSPLYGLFIEPRFKVSLKMKKKVAFVRDFVRAT